MRAGIRGIIGESFGEIFAGNCTALGIPTVCLKHEEIDALMSTVSEKSDTMIELNLENKSVNAKGTSYTFTMPESYRQSLASGAWDTTAALLANKELIEDKMKALPYLVKFSIESAN